MLPQRLPLDQMATTWAQALNPVISNPLMSGQLLQPQVLIAGSNVINHKLGRKLAGWIQVGINGVANIYDTQASNQSPQTTLNLVSDSNVTINLYVF